MTAHDDECLSLRVLGTTFGVRGLAPPDRSQVRLLLRPFLLEHKPVSRHEVFIDARRNDRGWTVTSGDEVAHAAVDGSALPAVVAVLNRVALERTTLFAVHAGVVSRGEAVVAFAGESGTGKSTLTAALLRQGLCYVSDEALCVDTAAAVVPYPKPLALSGWSASRLGLHPPPPGTEALYLPEALGSESVSSAAALRLRHVLVLVRGECPLRLTALPKAAAVTQLLRHSFNHYRAPDVAFRLAGDLARSASTWTLEYDDPVEEAELVTERLSAAATAAGNPA